MLDPSDVTEPGPYWYRVDMPDAEPVLVQIRAGEGDLELHFEGRGDYDLVAEVTGPLRGRCRSGLFDSAGEGGFSALHNGINVVGAGRHFAAWLG